MTTTFPPLSEDRLRTIDQLRQRLNQLSTSLGSLKVDVERNEPLPTWSSLQSSAQIVSHNLSQLMLTFDAHREFLTAAHAYPLTTFPANTHEALLNQLLRKRLEPTVEDWIKEHGTKKDNERTLGEADLQELWSFAGPASNAIVKAMVEDEAFEDEFTLAEREAGIETINTGLKRKLWENDSDAEDKMADIAQSKAEELEFDGIDTTQAPMPLETLLRFMSTGRLPT